MQYNQGRVEHPPLAVYMDAVYSAKKINQEQSQGSPGWRSSNGPLYEISSLQSAPIMALYELLHFYKGNLDLAAQSMMNAYARGSDDLAVAWQGEARELREKIDMLRYDFIRPKLIIMGQTDRPVRGGKSEAMGLESKLIDPEIVALLGRHRHWAN